MQTQKLIKLEMRRMDKSLADYEAMLPPVPESRIPEDSLLWEEFKVLIFSAKQLAELAMGTM